jgi:hypothetical protein
VKNDRGYEAVWASLNPLPCVPGGFTLNQLQPSPHRSQKDWYEVRTGLLIDCDPLRTSGHKKSNSTEVEKAASRTQAETIRKFLCDDLQWPRPILADSGNGTQLRFDINLPADQVSEDLVRNLLIGLAAKFNNEQTHLDAGVFESNRLAKLPGTWARKAPEAAGRPWRQSQILEVPERQIELPGTANRARQTITEAEIEAVPKVLLESTVSQLPIPQKSSAGLELPQNDVVKYEWLRNFLSHFNVPILAERASGKRLLFDIICPWEQKHGSTTGNSSTSVWYTRGHGYGFRCMHSKCGEMKRSWFDFREQVDPDGGANRGLPGLPGDATNAEIARYFRDQCPEFHNHARVYDAGRLRATFVASRWDLADQSNVLLMSALQPVCDRLRWELPEPAKPGRDYRRVLESHEFRSSTMSQIIPMLDKVRFEMLDSDAYLIGLPGGIVGDLRNGQTRPMVREDFITRRLRITARQQPTPIYGLFYAFDQQRERPARGRGMDAVDGEVVGILLAWVAALSHLASADRRGRKRKKLPR